MAALQNKMREQLAQSFLDALQQDQLPWKACWQSSLPENAINAKRYKGINALMLSYVSAQAGYQDHRWCTFKQAAEKGWHIKKGSKGAPVEYWAYYDREKRKLLSWTEARKVIRENPDYAQENLQLRSRVYTVFNGSQIEGIPELSHKSSITPDSILEKRDTLLKNMGLKLQEGGTQPYYAPEIDTVCIPYVHDFFDAYAYSCTLLHECGHATGHPSRLNRDLSAGYGTSGYAKEELRAEIASAFACQALDIQLTDQQLEAHMNLHKAYIQSWAKELQSAPEELFRAIKDAENISNYLIEKGEFLKERDSPEQDMEPASSVGRINYLGTDGRVVETMEFHSAQELIQTAKEESDVGAPFSLTLYENSEGKTIGTEFLQDLEVPFLEVKRERIARPAKMPSMAETIASAKRRAAALQKAPAPAKSFHKER